MTAGSRLRPIVMGVLRFIWLGLVAFGRSTAGVPTPLADPPPGHPERWCPDQPLTETELALARQLTGGRRRAKPSR